MDDYRFYMQAVSKALLIGNEISTMHWVIKGYNSESPKTALFYYAIAYTVLCITRAASRAVDNAYIAKPLIEQYKEQRDKLHDKVSDLEKTIESVKDFCNMTKHNIREVL